MDLIGDKRQEDVSTKVRMPQPPQIILPDHLLYVALKVVLLRLRNCPYYKFKQVVRHDEL
jgi:hypothetical protein